MDFRNCGWSAAEITIEMKRIERELVMREPRPERRCESAKKKCPTHDKQRASCYE